MKLSKRERVLIGLAFLSVLWTMTICFVILPQYEELEQDKALLWEMQGEKQKVDLYLEHFPELDDGLAPEMDVIVKEAEGADDFFYRGINNAFMDRNLQSMAGRAGVDIRRMNIEGPMSIDIQTDMDEPVLLDHGIVESVIIMEVKSQDAKSMMQFADEVYRELKSVVVSYMDVTAVYEKGLSGRNEYKGMSGVMEVRYYYEEIK